LKIVIECDGEYWHKDKRTDLIRQRKIEKEGWFVLRYTGTKINQCLGEIKDELLRVVGNHSGKYKFLNKKINYIKKWTVTRNQSLYNLSVQDDESYIANGFIVHNCRCVWIPYSKEWEEN
jgi:intein/homing endonuclease